MADEHLSRPTSATVSSVRTTMPEKTAYETGARKYPANRDPDPRDNFSQNAAGNKPPRNRVGLTRPANETNADTYESGGMDQRHVKRWPDRER